MLALFSWSCAIGYCFYVWKNRKNYAIDRVTIVIACSLLIIATIMTM